MIALLAASAVSLAVLQASINAPTQAFRGCLREAVAKATSQNVGGDAIEAYLRNACSGQMQTLKNAVVAFRTKNGMGKKAAIVDWRRVDRLERSNHLVREGTRIRLTAKGRLLLDAILGEIAAAESSGKPMALAVAG